MNKQQFQNQYTMEEIKPLQVNQELKTFFDNWYKNNELKKIYIKSAKNKNILDVVDYNKTVIRLTEEYINFEIEKCQKHCVDEIFKQKYIELLKSLINKDFNLTTFLGDEAIFIPELSDFMELKKFENLDVYNVVISYYPTSLKYRIEKLKEKLSEFMSSDDIKKYINKISIIIKDNRNENNPITSNH